MHKVIIHNEFKENESGSHEDNETKWILKNNIGKAKMGIVSTGNAALSLAKLTKHPHIFVPENTPKSKIELLKKYSANVKILGSNYPECYDLANKYMRKHNIYNVTAGKVKRHLGNAILAQKLHQKYKPKYVFIPASNFDLAVGLCKGFKTLNQTTVIVACVLPDHPLSPGESFADYNHEPYSSCITFEKDNIPALNKEYKNQENLLIVGIGDPDKVYEKYNKFYPKLDPVCYLPLFVSEITKVDEDIIVILTGEKK